jgi:hypothetical protein
MVITGTSGTLLNTNKACKKMPSTTAASIIPTRVHDNYYSFHLMVASGEAGTLAKSAPILSENKNSPGFYKFSHFSSSYKKLCPLLQQSARHTSALFFSS